MPFAILKAIDLRKNATFLSQGFMACKIEQTVGNNVFIRVFYDVLKDQTDFGFKCPYLPVRHT